MLGPRRRLLLAYVLTPVVGTLTLFAIPALVLGGEWASSGVFNLSTFFAPVVLPVMYAVEWVAIRVARARHHPPEAITAPRVLAASGVIGLLGLAGTVGLLASTPFSPALLATGLATGVAMGGTFCAIRGAPTPALD